VNIELRQQLQKWDKHLLNTRLRKHFWLSENTQFFPLQLRSRTTPRGGETSMLTSMSSMFSKHR